MRISVLSDGAANRDAPSRFSPPAACLRTNFVSSRPICPDLGYRIRVIATLLAMFSLATALIFHSDLADQNQFIHFFKNVAMAGGLIQVAAFGGGRLTVGARR